MIRMLILGYVFTIRRRTALFAYQRLTPWRHESADMVNGYIGEADRCGKSELKGVGL
jgi:hypothetical protein